MKKLRRKRISEIERERYYTLKEIHHCVRIPLRTLEHWCQKGEIQAIKPRGKYFVRGEDFLEFLGVERFTSAIHSYIILDSVSTELYSWLMAKGYPLYELLPQQKLPRFPPDVNEWIPGEPLVEPPLPRWILDYGKEKKTPGWFWRNLFNPSR
jgi:hypothetical protein